MDILAVIIVGFIAIFVFSMFRILREYERGVIFTLGRFWRVKGPGLIIVVPILQQMVRVDLRTIVMEVGLKPFVLNLELKKGLLCLRLV